MGMEMRIQSRPGSSGAKLLPVGRQGGIYQVAQFYGNTDQWKESSLGDGRCHPYGWNIPAVQEDPIFGGYNLQLQ